MREILFRAQIRKKGEKVSIGGSPLPGIWIYGNLCAHNPVEGGHSLICDTETLQKIPVHSDTVGQWTGLTDKNGVKIFEGDIVRFDYAEPDVDGTTYSSPRLVKWDAENAGFCVESDYEFETLFGLSWYVIGNIYDDPELLGKEVKDV